MPICQWICYAQGAVICDSTTRKQPPVRHKLLGYTHTHTHSNTHMQTEAEAGTVKYGK